MNLKKDGITIAGTIIVDIVKDIDTYPEVGMLANIGEVSKSVGGCVPNTAINLAKIDKATDIRVIGEVGNDENGRFVVSKLKENGINVEGVVTNAKKQTSFTDVMSLPSGERTFFSQRGANEDFAPENINIDLLKCEMLHIGYILLLDRFDAYDDEYGTVMAGFLAKLQEKGIKTSVDVVSNVDGDYSRKIVPALRYCNYAIMNEIECCGIWGIDACDENGRILIDNIRTCMEKMQHCGVRDKVIIHSKEAGFILDSKSSSFEYVPSLDIPKSLIKGSVGAGDAFCAGCLYGIYNNYNDREILEFASAAAACSLFESNSVDGIKNKEQILETARKYPRLTGIF